MNKIFLFVLLLVSFQINAKTLISSDDSTGLEKKDGKVFIVHVVEPKETFYSISKRYKVTVEDIKKYNPESNDGLKIGQTILVITKLKAGSAPTTDSQANSTNTNAVGAVTHNVTAKETLFSISKKYNVTIDELKNANPEIASGLKIGQVITIPSKGKKPVEVKEEKKVEQKKAEENKEKKAEEKKEESKEEKKKEEKKVEIAKEKEAAQEKETKKKDKETDISGVNVASTSTTVGGYTKISETGLGELMENNDASKYLALHKTAPVGTIIQVVNLTNNQKIFVKVVGALPSGSAPGVVIQMTSKAFEKLTTSSSEKQIKTEISYIKD